ncbi:tRNA pseudouridine(55) synthase TruB [Dehalococcoidia bacterium]|nr:tRNA pseudouridine(55) synthase TruB [Dehalococcoidia bacterium]
MGSRPNDGIISVDKPHGVTSMDVVRRIKRASGIKRIGHGGTLDPIATGVIPICVGQATRMMEYVIDSSKEYSGVVQLGVTTDTYDSEGEVTQTTECARMGPGQVETALELFRGQINQVPPMYSALKKDGKRLYELARQGIEVQRDPRPVNVYDIELADWTPPLATVHVHCGRGFYMRSLAHDLGQALGCGGHLQRLIRERSGPFKLQEAVSLQELEVAFSNGTWTSHLHSPDAVLVNMPAIIAGRQSQELIRNGRPIPVGTSDLGSSEIDRCRAYTADGRFIAIMRFDAPLQQWKPEKVFHTD